jgi:hypothetical protein
MNDGTIAIVREQRREYINQHNLNKVEQIDVLHSERKEVIKGGRIELSISKLGAQ